MKTQNKNCTRCSVKLYKSTGHRTYLYTMHRFTVERQKGTCVCDLTGATASTRDQGHIWMRNAPHCPGPHGGTAGFRVNLDVVDERPGEQTALGFQLKSFGVEWKQSLGSRQSFRWSDHRGQGQTVGSSWRWTRRPSSSTTACPRCRAPVVYATDSDCPPAPGTPGRKLSSSSPSKRKTRSSPSWRSPPHSPGSPPFPPWDCLVSKWQKNKKNNNVWV